MGVDGRGWVRGGRDGGRGWGGGRGGREGGMRRGGWIKGAWDGMEENRANNKKIRMEHKF